LHGIKSAKGKSTFAQKAGKKKKSSNLTTFKYALWKVVVYADRA